MLFKFKDQNLYDPDYRKHIIPYLRAIKKDKAPAAVTAYAGILAVQDSVKPTDGLLSNWLTLGEGSEPYSLTMVPYAMCHLMYQSIFSDTMGYLPFTVLDEDRKWGDIKEFDSDGHDNIN
jgi:hypothetical protein